MLHTNLIEKNQDFEQFKQLIESKFPNTNIYISNGWIDSHVHTYKKAKYFYSNKDFPHFKGVVAAIDAGSSGVKNYKDAISNEDFPFETFYLLNVSSDGINRKDELNNPTFEKDALVNAINDPKVVGYKMRYSSQAISKDNVSYKKILDSIQDLPGPIMYHVGNQPPDLSELLCRVSKRPTDIITHTYHGKNDVITNYIGENNYKNKFDIGFGNESFSFKTFKKLNDLNFKPNTISTDLHSQSAMNTTCVLPEILSIFLDSGLTIDEVINMVTINPFKIFLKNKFKNYKNTFTAFKVIDETREIHDSSGESIIIKKKIIPIGAWTKNRGVIYE